MKVNKSRKQRLLGLVNNHLAYQEYNTILDDLDKQVEQGYLKRIVSVLRLKQCHFLGRSVKVNCTSNLLFIFSSSKSETQKPKRAKKPLHRNRCQRMPSVLWTDEDDLFKGLDPSSRLKTIPFLRNPFIRMSSNQRPTRAPFRLIESSMGCHRLQNPTQDCCIITSRIALCS